MYQQQSPAVHEISWDSLLTMGSTLIDQNISFSAKKVNSLKKIAQRLPERAHVVPPKTPGTLRSTIEERRQLPKFGACEGQDPNFVERVVHKMPKVKIHWEGKFFPQLPKTKRAPRTDLFILTGGIPAANSPVNMTVPESPRTPRNKIRCRHCGQAHWSHRCPNRSRNKRQPRKNNYKKKKADPALLSDSPPSAPAPKKKKYKFDFKVRHNSFKKRDNCKWVASPRYK